MRTYFFIASSLSLLLVACASSGTGSPAAQPKASASEGDGARIDTSDRALKFKPGPGCSGCLAIDPQDPDYKPRLPDAYNVDGTRYWGLFKICVTTTGEVNTVRVVKSTNVETIDESWKGTIMNWRYNPYLEKGAPVPFCYVLRLDVTASY